MKYSLLDVLCDPISGEDLILHVTKEINNDIIEGYLMNPRGNKYPITNGIPRFVTDDLYTSNFSFEWNKHQTTQLDSAHNSLESEERFAASLPYELEALSGKFVLDVGCGMGRFAEVILKYGGIVVGIDLSFAVDAAQKNLGHNKNSEFIQANIYHLPFKVNSFDLIYSLGVLHHTPNPRKAFDQLPRLLKHKGILMTTMYASYNKAYVLSSEFWRKVVRPLPRKWLYYLAHISIPLYYIWKLPIIGKVLSHILPLNQHPRAEWRVLDTFDWYSPVYQFYYTHPEIYQWYTENNLKNIVVKGPGISLAGEKIDD